MKLLLIISMLFIFSACTGNKPEDDAGPTDTSENDTGSVDTSNYEHNVSCQCKGAVSAVTGRSDKNLEHAKLSAGAVCVGLQGEKEIAMKNPEDLTEEDALKIQLILEEALQQVLTGNVDDSVLSEIYNCTES